MNTARWRPALALAVATGLLAACSDVTGPHSFRRPGVLLVSGWTGNIPLTAGTGKDVTWNAPPETADIAPPRTLEVPDTVDAGAAFVAVTTTIGPSGCWRADGQQVSVEGDTVVLKPYDAHSGAEVCTEALVFLAHESTLVLYEPGEWTVRVEGRRVRMGDEVRDEPVTAEKQVIVR